MDASVSVKADETTALDEEEALRRVTTAPLLSCRSGRRAARKDAAKSFRPTRTAQVGGCPPRTYAVGDDPLPADKTGDDLGGALRPVSESRDVRPRTPRTGDLRSLRGEGIRWRSPRSASGSCSRAAVCSTARAGLAAARGCSTPSSGAHLRVPAPRASSGQACSRRRCRLAR